MSGAEDDVTIEMIPVDRIRVLNPRVRDTRKFLEIVDSIERVGLKQPIKVSRARGPDGDDVYNLVYGQGRLEAYIRLGQTEIPAIVTELSEKESLLLGLVENAARRKHRPLELLREFGALRERGYPVAEIARKTGYSTRHVRGLLKLLEAGEERLLVAVESGKMPLKVAVAIAAADDRRVQKILTEAFEMGELTLKELVQARRQMERRQRYGKERHAPVSEGGSGAPVSTNAALHLLKEEAARYEREFKRAKLVSSQLLFIVEGFRVLLADEHFVTLLRAERVHTLPAQLAHLIKTPGEA